MKEKIEIVIAQNGILVDWGDTRVNIYKGEPKSIAEMLTTLSGYLGGFFSGEFSRETIHIKTAIDEYFQDNEGS